MKFKDLSIGDKFEFREEYVPHYIKRDDSTAFCKYLCECFIRVDSNTEVYKQLTTGENNEAN